MSLGGGDKLARGAKSAVFPSNSHIPQEKWDAIWAKDAEPVQEVNTANTEENEPETKQCSVA
jgi:hypothetical protein